mmetsp:Transcript_136004/g.435043  ORF Transcript_136004/g.435043 Transcript_136004/m.435043 type:complete len:280 (-) Transcript_136004:421-1260(-)
MILGDFRLKLLDDEQFRLVVNLALQDGFNFSQPLKLGNLNITALLTQTRGSVWWTDHDTVHEFDKAFHWIKKSVPDGLLYQSDFCWLFDGLFVRNDRYQRLHFDCHRLVLALHSNGREPGARNEGKGQRSVTDGFQPNRDACRELVVSGAHWRQRCSVLGIYCPDAEPLPELRFSRGQPPSVCYANWRHSLLRWVVVLNRCRRCVLPRRHEVVSKSSSSSRSSSSSSSSRRRRGCGRTLNKRFLGTDSAHLGSTTRTHDNCSANDIVEVVGWAPPSRPA